jgi:NitT/TauT family transport system permease protein
MSVKKAKVKMKPKRVIDIIVSVTLPVTVGALVLVLWQTRVIHAVLGLTEVQLPLLSRIFELITVSYASIAEDVGYSLRVILGGLLVGSLIGFLIAAVAAVFPKCKGALTVLSALNALPVVALSPIMGLWFAKSAMSAKTAVAAILCMVPMSVNAYRGLTDLKPFSEELMHSYAANKATIFFKLRLPNCIPHIFVGLKINVASAMIGTMISEYFSADGKGIGRVIRDSMGSSQIVRGWAYIFVAAVIGVLLFMIIMLLQRYAGKVWRAVTGYLAERRENST